MSLIIQAVSWLLNLLVIAIVIRAILSWFMQVGGDPITRLLVDITDPILQPIRQIMQRLLPLPIDFSPLVAILLLQFLAGLVTRYAYG